MDVEVAQGLMTIQQHKAAAYPVRRCSAVPKKRIEMMQSSLHLSLLPKINLCALFVRSVPFAIIRSLVDLGRESERFIKRVKVHMS